MAGAALLDDLASYPHFGGSLHLAHEAHEHLQQSEPVFAEPALEDDEEASCPSDSDNSEYRSHQRRAKKPNLSGRFRYRALSRRVQAVAAPGVRSAEASGLPPTHAEPSLLMLQRAPGEQGGREEAGRRVPPAGAAAGGEQPPGRARPPDAAQARPRHRLRRGAAALPAAGAPARGEGCVLVVTLHFRLPASSPYVWQRQQPGASAPAAGPAALLCHALLVSRCRQS